MVKSYSYQDILPYFEHCRPLLDRRALVDSSSTSTCSSSCLDLEDLEN